MINFDWYLDNNTKIECISPSREQFANLYILKHFVLRRLSNSFDYLLRILSDFPLIALEISTNTVKFVVGGTEKKK